MIKCQKCGSRIRMGRLFCTECGTYLHAGSPLITEPLSQDELPVSEADTWLRHVDGYEEAVLPEAAIALRITVAENGRETLFPLPMGEICLGRRDTARGAFPELDLSPDGGRKAGVSRLHVRVYQVGNRLFVEDVDSANGTFLNGRRLNPYLPYPLKEGDTLQLGSLKLLVAFVRAEPESSATPKERGKDDA
jgi:hypothetical protein